MREVLKLIILATLLALGSFPLFSKAGAELIGIAQLGKTAHSSLEANFEQVGPQKYMTAGRHQFRSLWTRDFCFSVRGLLVAKQFDLVREQLDLIIGSRRPADSLVPRSLESKDRIFKALRLSETQGKVALQVFYHLLSEAESTLGLPSVEHLGRPLQTDLVPEYTSENGTEAIDSNLLVVTAALDYAETTGDLKWFASEEAALRKIYLYYDDKIVDGLIWQPAFSDWQDSVSREGRTFLTNLLYWHLQNKLLKYPAFAVNSARADKTKIRIRELFFDKERGLFKSLDHGPQISLDGNLAALDFNFLSGKEATSLFAALRAYPLWNGPAGIPGFATYPDYPDGDLSWTSKAAGLRHYHDEYYWSWLIAYAVKISSQMGDVKEALRISQRLQSIVERDGAVVELYFPDLRPWSSLELQAERPFSWSSAYVLDALHSIESKRSRSP